MPLKIERQKNREGRYTIVLEGHLDTQTYGQLEQEIEALIRQPLVLILDMAGLQYISSMGLRVILRARKSLEAQHGQLLLVNLQPQIARVIEIANALPKAQIFTSVAEADRYFDLMQRKSIEEQPRPIKPPPRA
jgi:anti-sigma B factor antagonist